MDPPRLLASSALEDSLPLSRSIKSINCQKEQVRDPDVGVVFYNEPQLLNPVIIC